MSIQSEIDRIALSKTKIAGSLAEKGVTVPESVRLDELSGLIGGLKLSTLPENYILYSGFSDGSQPTDVIFSGKIIYQNAFYGMTNLLHASLGDRVESVGSNAFFNCNGLLTMAIPPTLREIGAYSFNGCSALTELSLPGACVISGSASSNASFRGCTALRTVVIGGPEDAVPSTENLGPYAFFGCNNLQSVIVYTMDGTGPDNMFIKSGTTTYIPVVYRKA